MKNRKAGELIEIFGDFWLGMAGAAAQGLATFSQRRREDKSKEGETPDFFARASEAVTHIAHNAQEVARHTERQLNQGKDF